MSGALRSGTRLGPFRIVAPLGAGGMGEVYRAHDTKLDRPVAIKVLPDSVVRDADRVRRFVQEARSASSLSHPNIVTIYDIGETVPVEQGAEAAADASAVHFIAMELVEGATLRQLFDDRSIEPRTLLAHLAQAADGLAKAHAAGIVHRDLKPENIMVTRDGYAKVLDFGLAKLTEIAPSGSALAHAPTTAGEQATRDGAVVGTVGYMSPEQAMGKPVDHRTDLFAFGCLLYEAATGRKPFTGESSVDVLHAIVREKPTPVEEIAPQIPRALARTVRRCLAKEPDRRYQSMKDLALELHEMVDEWETLALPSGTVSSGSALSGREAGKRGVGLGRWIAIGTAGAALLIAAVTLWRGAGRREPAPAGFQRMTITAATTTGDVAGAALSPDGRYLVSVRRQADGRSLWLRQLTTGSDVQLLAPQGALELRNPAFTPDGDYVTFTLSDERRSIFTLMRLPVLGGSPRRLVVDVDTPAAFAPDGERIAYVRNRVPEGEHALLIAKADGSEESALAVRKRTERHGFLPGESGLGPAWSPDGRSLAVAGFDATGGYRGEVLLVDVASGAERRIGDAVWLGVSGLAWLPDGSGLVLAGILRGTSFMPQLWRLSIADGSLSRITNDSQGYVGASVSADGRALTSVQLSRSSTLWRHPLDELGGERQLTFSSRELIHDLGVSPDGELYFAFERGRVAGVARMDLASGEPFVLSKPEVPSVEAQASRDGRTLMMRSLLPDGRISLRVAERDGSAAREVPTRGTFDAYALHPDGTWFAVSDVRGIWRQPIDGGEAVLLVEEAPASVIGFSPDGRRLAYFRREATAEGSLRSLIAVIDAAGGPPIAELERPVGWVADRTRWAPDGEGFTIRVREGDGFNVWRLPLGGGPPERLTGFEGVPLWDYAISPDGGTLYFTKGEESSDAVLIENFL